MTYKIEDVVYETGLFWVLRDEKNGRYTVFSTCSTHSTSDSSYQLDESGFTFAKARADYLQAAGGNAWGNSWK